MAKVRPVTGLLLFLLLIMTTLTASETARSAYERGRKEEARQNYEVAYAAYKVAYSLQPANIEYRTAATRLQFLAAAAKIHRGVQLHNGGKFQEALLQFEAAREIDPSSAIASQQIETTKKAIATSHAPGGSTHPTSEEDALNAELDAIDGPVKLAPVSDVPITLKLTEDSKVIYETIGKLAGINILFDPDYNSRHMRVEMNGVNLLQALQALALQSKTFWKPVTPNTIFVAADNPAKRKELEQNVIKTFYLSNMSQPTELQDVVNAVRTVLEVSRIQQLATQQAIVMRGTPDQILLAEKLVGDIDKAPPEVVVEVAVMQVSRDKVKNLGINPPSSASVQLQSNTSSSSTSSSSSSSSSTSSSTNSMSLNSLANLNATDFAVTIGSASLNALYSDSSTKIIQNPQLRSINGQKASLKIGERVPTATGSYSSGVSTGTVSALVNTQFQYLDVGVNVDITPRVYDNGDIGLKISLDVSSVTSYVSIGGISEPEIGQRKIEHEIRLKNGEVNLLGGMFETEDTKSISGIPGLSQIPVLKYLFSETNKETTHNEVVFALIPHIVRDREIVPLNRRTLDVGTANGIQLHYAANRSVTAGATGQAASIVPVSVAQSAVVAKATAAFDPPFVSTQVGGTFSVNVMLANAENASAVPLRLVYDPSRLEVVNVSNGGFLDQGEQIVAISHRENTAAGILEATASRPRGTGGASGSGAVLTVTFLAKSTGLSRLTVTDANVVHPDGPMLAIPATEMSVTVQ